MKPLFPFYGSKWREAKRYPAPRGRVIEPFAGSAGYSVFHAPERVLLIDRDPIIVGVWQYLIAATEREVRALPDLEVGESVDELRELPQEARWLIGFWLNRGSAQPKKRRTAYSARTDRAQLTWGERARSRIASELGGIRRWDVHLGSFEDAPLDAGASYFVDPPYEDKGQHYRFSSVDYAALAEWCQTLPGEVIVCEQSGASWLPFRDLGTFKSSRGVSQEVVWTGNVAAETLF